MSRLTYIMHFYLPFALALPLAELIECIWFLFLLVLNKERSAPARPLITFKKMICKYIIYLNTYLNVYHVIMKMATRTEWNVNNLLSLI